MLILLYFLTCFSTDDALPTPHHLKFETVPAESEFYLQYPVDVTVDSKGRFLVLDGLARTVFVWDAKGKFLGRFGKPGNGPGEFLFAEFNTKQAQIDTHGERIYVYESGKRMLHIFGSDFTFIEAKILKLGIGSGRTRFFGFTNGQTILMHNQNYYIEEPTSHVLLYDEDLKPFKTLMTFPDRLYTSQEGNDGTIWTIHVFSPQLTLFTDSFRGIFLSGTGEHPEFDVYDPRGKKMETVRFTAKREPVTSQDKEEFLDQTWFKSRSHYRTLFPERFPYYQQICTIKDRGYLLYRVSPIYGRVSGIVIDNKGQTIGPFRYKCGENGGLYGSSGRIIAVNTDDIGDYQIFELYIPTR